MGLVVLLKHSKRSCLTHFEYYMLFIKGKLLFSTYWSHFFSYLKSSFFYWEDTYLFVQHSLRFTSSSVVCRLVLPSFFLCLSVPSAYTFLLLNSCCCPGWGATDHLWVDYCTSDSRNCPEAGQTEYQTDKIQQGNRADISSRIFLPGFFPVLFYLLKISFIYTPTFSSMGIQSNLCLSPLLHNTS